MLEKNRSTLKFEEYYVFESIIIFFTEIIKISLSLYISKLENDRFVLDTL